MFATYLSSAKPYSMHWSATMKTTTQSKLEEENNWLLVIVLIKFKNWKWSSLLRPLQSAKAAKTTEKSKWRKTP